MPRDDPARSSQANRNEGRQLYSKKEKYLNISIIIIDEK
jgi:hypothetical protein